MARYRAESGRRGRFLQVAPSEGPFVERTQQIYQSHLFGGVAANIEESWAADEHANRTRSRDGHVESVAIE